MYRPRKEEWYVDGYSHVIRDLILYNNNVLCISEIININH